MSKRDLKKYLSSLTKEQLEEQVLDLYTRFKPVKVYYNFVFNPNEKKLIEEAKFKIYKEYFPNTKRKPKMRRSVAHKFVKHFVTLGVDPMLILDLMLYNIEIAQAYTSEKMIRQEAFYISMLRSFKEAIDFSKKNGLFSECSGRIEKIAETSWQQDWFNKTAFENALE